MDDKHKLYIVVGTFMLVAVLGLWLLYRKHREHFERPRSVRSASPSQKVRYQCIISDTSSPFFWMSTNAAMTNIKGGTTFQFVYDTFLQTVTVMLVDDLTFTLQGDLMYTSVDLVDASWSKFDDTVGGWVAIGAFPDCLLTKPMHIGSVTSQPWYNPAWNLDVWHAGEFPAKVWAMGNGSPNAGGLAGCTVGIVAPRLHTVDPPVWPGRTPNDTRVQPAGNPAPAPIPSLLLYITFSCFPGQSLIGMCGGTQGYLPSGTVPSPLTNMIIPSFIGTYVSNAN